MIKSLIVTVEEFSFSGALRKHLNVTYIAEAKKCVLENKMVPQVLQLLLLIFLLV